ncbi:MAG: beta-ketoacyl synthase N-terminal-like domain-containing protein [Steroidobacteraceae bacterium]
MPKLKRSCYFTGAALHTSLGVDLASNLAAVQLAPATPTRAVAHYAQQQTELPYKLLADRPLQHLDTRLDTVIEPLIETALTAAGLTAAQRRKVGLFLGTSSFDICATEDHYRHALQQDAQAIAMAESSSLGNLALNICSRFDLRGPSYSFNTACTASANALAYADGMIRSGQLDHALVLGVETFNSITALGFNGLQLLTPTAMRPFSPERNGLVLGEGCSALVLSHDQHRATDFRLVASSNLCDTFGMSAANPDGSTIAQVIEQALQRAGLTAGDIAAIKTHGTASLSNDEAESAGMRRVFESMPPLTALKPFIGHTLGACGLNELLLFCGAAEQGFLIGTPGIGMGDEKLGVVLNQQCRELLPGYFMLNYFGFGGNNTSLIVSNLPEQAA